MKCEVLSLGGSVIFPKSKDDIDIEYLKKFTALLRSCKDKKFIIVTGGGWIARKYIRALKEAGASQKECCLIGIGVTKLNALFLAKFANQDAAPTVPSSVKEIKKLLEKYRIVFVGGLSYEENNTSDGTAAKIAHVLKTDFINITDVPGLYTKDPRKYNDADIIRKISFEKFDALVANMDYHPGQHFVLDQEAAKIIKKYRIKTMILGRDIGNIRNCLKNKPFEGTIIS
ncbi:MAG: UMP kinase [Nanoarchaeota archaeon]